MSIWDLCIRRPVFTVMLVSAPLVLGLVSYMRLGVDLFPNVDMPVVVVTTTLKGASVEEMESSVTKPLEEIINTISGIDELRSTTKEGISQISVLFFIEKDRDVAAQEVRDKISTIQARLPQGTDPPIIDKFDLDASPVMTIAVSGRRSLQEITEIARKRIKEDLESLSGVGAVILVGGRQRAINIYVDTDKLTGYNLSIEDVRQALLRQNIELPGGRVDRREQELVLRTMGRVETPAAFRELIITDQGGYPVRVKDIARVEDSFEEPRGLSRLDGQNSVSLIVQKQSGSNTVRVVDTVKKRMAELASTLPPDIQMLVIRDQSRFIKASIDEVKFHLVVGGILVALTVLLFIRDWRTTLIASLSIPLSIVATFAFMDSMGFTLNNITMLGLILAIGIVIDDAVVINENIFRHMEEYRRPAMQAASTGTREIALAVLATTLSLVVIFVPVAFMGGRIGKFFSSFGFTVGFAVLASMGISFTITPMLCSRFLKLKAGKHGSKSGLVWRAIDGAYGAILRWSLRHRWAIVLSAVAMIPVGLAAFAAVGKEFVPRDDQSEFEVALTLPEGCTLERADAIFREIEGRLRTLRGVTHLFTTIGDTTGRMARGQGDVEKGVIYVRLLDLHERPYTQFDVMADARKILADYPELRAAVQDVSAFQVSGFRQVMIDLNLRGPDLAKLQQYAGDPRSRPARPQNAGAAGPQPESIVDWMRKQGYFVDIDTSLSLRKPELRVHIDREKAADLGIPVQTIASTLNVAVGGEPVSKYKEFDEQYDVWLRAELPMRDQPDRIAELRMPSPKAGLVQLANLATLELAKGPSTIDRFGRQRQVVVSANLEGQSLGEAVAALSEHVRSMNLPASYRWEFIGRAKALAETNYNFLIAFILSFIFMYMILAAQFESFVHPITILLALPLTLPFALISLLLLRTNLDIFAMFGLFMLFGIVKKNGILQIDYTNVLRAQGVPRDEAILQANHTRLRPILMTTVMLIAAMIPMALGRGPGAASRASLAKVIVGGQTLSLLLTLLVTPVAYSLWDDLAQLTSRWFGRRHEVRAKRAEPSPVEELPPPTEELVSEPAR